jgi:hypothetical protein
MGRLPTLHNTQKNDSFEGIPQLLAKAGVENCDEDVKEFIQKEIKNYIRSVVEYPGILTYLSFLSFAY